jgi:lysophospholipase L1-like esterase
MNLKLLSLAAILGVAVSGLAQSTSAPPRAEVRQKARDRAFEPVKDDPRLPRVLLIGDSISIGYTAAVRDLLKGKANVHRIPTNGGPTTNGLAHLPQWLGEGKWDVIHFNWGLHDLKFMPDGQRQVSPAAYEKNLRALVRQLKATRARLIWATTTPVPAGVTPPRKNEDVLAYNAIAQKIMAENNIAVDDLYGFAGPKLKEIQQPANVHFTPQGYRVLARQVAASIASALAADK